MTDIIERLRNWRNVHLARLHLLMEEAASEVARLRTVCECYAHSSAAACREIASLRQVSSQENFPTPENAAQRETPCPYVVGKTTQYCSLTPLTLTDEEREAVENCIYASERIGDDWSDKQAALLRGLLERLGPAANSTPIHRNDCGESRTGSDGETAGEEAAECTVQSEKCPQRDRLVRSLESRLEDLRTASDQADAEYREEIARLRLTDADRAAIAWCVEMAATTATECDEELAALRGLLDRTK